MKTVVKWIGILVVVIAAVAAVFAMLAAALSWAWNQVVPSTFHGPSLDFGAALALLIVISIISNFFRSSSTSKTN